MSRAESGDERAERIAAELREATREAAGVLKDLRAAVKTARGEVEQYLHDECQRALNQNTANMLDTVRQITGDHEARVIRRVIEYAALIENNFSRETLIQEAANRIEKLIVPFIEQSQKPRSAGPGEVVISLCDRPHAD